MPRVLVVEDNEDERLIYSSVLNYNGFDVTEAGNAIDGIRLAKSERPDVILMDVRLPGLNGLLATEILQASPETKSIPVVCMSAFDITAAKAKESGCQHILRKPIAPTSLVHALRSVLSAEL